MHNKQMVNYYLYNHQTDRVSEMERKEGPVFGAHLIDDQFSSGKRDVESSRKKGRR